MLSNWKTTLAGILGAGALLFNNLVQNHQALTLGNILPALGTLLVGLFAHDSNNPTPPATPSV